MTQPVSLHSKNLDIEALRGIAIAITFVAHLGELVPAWQGWTTYFWLGGGVDLFFAISGFLIVSGLSVSSGRERDFKTFAFRFWTRRLFRLWPAAIFWATLLLVLSETLPLSSAWGSRSDVFWGWLFAIVNVENFYVSMCTNNVIFSCSSTPLGHYWSLSLEEQFYLLIPCILFFTRSRALLIPVFLLAAVGQGLMERPWNTLWWFIRTDALLYGCVVALAWRHYPQFASRLLSRCSIAVARSVLALALIALVVTARQAWVPLHMGSVAISAGLCVAMVSANRKLIAVPGLPQRLASYVGSRSYSIYLVHNPVLNLTRQVVHDLGYPGGEAEWARLIAVAIALSITLFLAEISFRLIEMPFRQYGRTLSAALPVQSVAAAKGSS